MIRDQITALCKALLWGLCVLLFPILSGTLAAVFALGALETLLLQGVFMLLSLVIPLCLIRTKRWSRSEIGFDQIDAAGCKRALYFVPLLTIFIPAAVRGFQIRSVAFCLCNLFLYLMVGISEEVYFRGIIPKYLSKAFSPGRIIMISTLIFGIGHVASAFTASTGLEVGLSVLNAVIFGWLAIEMALLANNIIPGILLHFLFDYETKIVALQGDALLIAECVRGAVMAACAVWLAVIVHKNHSALRTNGFTSS